VADWPNKREGQKIKKRGYEVMKNVLMDFDIYMSGRGWTKNTRYTYCLILKKFLQCNLAINDFTREDARRYLAELRKIWTRKTAKQHLLALRAFWIFCGLDSTIWNIKIIPERKIPKHLSLQETDKLLGAISGDDISMLRDKAMYELIYAAGLKTGEAMSLRASDVNFTAQTVKVHGRAAFFGNAAASALYKYTIRRSELLPENDLLFVNFTGKRLSRQRYCTRLKRYALKAGIPEDKATPQALRNSLAVHLLDNGANMKSVQNIMRYKQSWHIFRYAEITPKFLTGVKGLAVA
jgi:integrase/recombinase XerD